MKSLFITLALALFFMATVTAQNVGIGTTSPNANAALEIKSNDKGFLMPRLSTTACWCMIRPAQVFTTTMVANGNQ
jgi:hypothetical protein